MIGAPVSPCSRYCFTVDLVDDAALVDEYLQLHEPGGVWPMVLLHLRALGIVNMEIWREDRRLFMVIDAAGDFPRAPVSEINQPELARWDALMRRFHRHGPADSGDSWRTMRRIFNLSDHDRQGS